MNSIMMTATRAPDVMPLPSRMPRNPSPSWSGNTHLFWNDVPTQNEMPATAAFRWSNPSWMTIFIPCTKSRLSSTTRYAAATGLGMAISTAAILGRNAIATMLAPSTTPTRRAPMPVTSASEMLVE